MRSSVHQRIAAGIARQSDVWMAREALGQCHRVLLRRRLSASVLTADLEEMFRGCRVLHPRAPDPAAVPPADLHRAR